MVSGLYTDGFGNGAVAESARDCECSVFKLGSVRSIAT